MGSVYAIETYTYEDYKLWKGDWELIDGLPLAMAPSPMRDHQRIGAELLSFLADEVRECEECEVVYELDYIVDSENVLRPDIALICGEESDYIRKAPKIVIEIVSSSTARRDEKVKFEIYEREKVLYYILVYPKTLDAKIYKIENNIYQKQGDFTKEKYLFDELECKVEVDFKEVFKKFKR
ncbi:MAG TPA: Uma2 family endonuclease [Campylobacterales bacterium]|nr:Uma2 family endonuclease [Campylobacterales bacterium]